MRPSLGVWVVRHVIAAASACGCRLLRMSAASSRMRACRHKRKLCLQSISQSRVCSCDVNRPMVSTGACICQGMQQTSVLRRVYSDAQGITVLHSGNASTTSAASLPHFVRFAHLTGPGSQCAVPAAE